MTLRISYVNGVFLPHADATIPIEDRGHLFADGVYEVLLVKKNTLLNGAEHMQRLKHSLEGIKIPYLVEPEALTALILRLLKENGVDEGIVYLQISRGVAPRNHPFPIPEAKPSLVMMWMGSPVHSLQDYQQGVSAITHPDMRWKRRDFKTICLLPNILAKEEAVRQQAVEAILLEDHDVVTEGSSSNIFMVDKQQVLHTHPATTAILGGVTRKNILMLARSAGIKVCEEPFSLLEMQGAQEVFLTSTTKYVLPIVRVNQNMVGDGSVGAITRQLMAAYEVFMEAQLYKDQPVHYARHTS